MHVDANVHSTVISFFSIEKNKHSIVKHKFSIRTRSGVEDSFAYYSLEYQQP